MAKAIATMEPILQEYNEVKKEIGKAVRSTIRSDRDPATFERQLNSIKKNSDFIENLVELGKIRLKK